MMDYVRKPASTFPDDLMASPNPNIPMDLNRWVQRHNRAVMAFHKESVGAMHGGLTAEERGILTLLEGLDALAASGMAIEPYGSEYVWGQLLSAAHNLLNFDLGRLDEWSARVVVV